MRKVLGLAIVLCVLLLSVSMAYAAGAVSGANNIVGGTNAADNLPAMADKLKAGIPNGYDATAKLIDSSSSAGTDATGKPGVIIRPIRPLPSRFLMWTNNGEHIMWGRMGNGYFTGQDNNGKKAWGIYQNGVFAGFYGGDFFYGKYGFMQWKAVNLFGEKYSAGGYMVFPRIVPMVTAQDIQN